MSSDPRLRLPAMFALFLAGSVAAQNDAPPARFGVDTGERKPLNTVVPVYPEKARRERLEGDVEVCFNIDREGRTSRVRVRSSTDRVFERPAVLAARASTYLPLPPDRSLSGIKTCRTFRFRLLPVAIEKPGSEDD